MLWYLKVPLPSTLVAYKVTGIIPHAALHVKLGEEINQSSVFMCGTTFVLGVLGRLLIWSLLNWCYKTIYLLFIGVENVLGSIQFPSVVSVMALQYEHRLCRLELQVQLMVFCSNLW